MVSKKRSEDQLTYFFIALVVALIVAPIVSIIPSKHQRALSQIRQMARAAGLRVDLVKVEDPDPDPDRYISGTGRPLARELSVAAWRLPRPRPRDWRSMPLVEWEIVRVGGEWRWIGDPPTPDGFASYVAEELITMPSGIVKVEEKSYQLTVYWHEHADQISADLVIRFLKSCLERPTH